MNKVVKIITACAFLIVLPSLVAASSGQSGSFAAVSKFGNQIYSGGSTVLNRGEDLLSGCLKTTFSIFNPCLDLIKGTTGVILAPIERPRAVWDAIAKKTKALRGNSIPMPKKPTLTN